MMAKRLLAVFVVALFVLMLSCASAKEEWCPRCHGEGKIEQDTQPNPFGGANDPFSSPGGKIKVTCPVCKGKGKVTKLN